ncbi:uncharacterized protein BC739_005903 [Kutzneria viridogrisea]|uniref:DUF418 domain-containing protein n=2 Tax=Kutzneria viridogrisea TaxID=47990 RepID=A0ABR6BPX8_9PSEU|nr:uncharacterized protein [Kutzneria viridogrisea]
MRRSDETALRPIADDVSPRGLEAGGMSTIQGRLTAVDMLRGIAILGTLGTNIWLFTSPHGPVSGLAEGGTVHAVLLYLCNGKFLGLLTVLFGVGLELQYRSARRDGRRWPGWYLWRSALLLAEGAAHYVLIFEFDVLMSYAVTAVLVSFLVSRSTRVIRTWMITLGGLHVLSMGLITAYLVSAGDFTISAGGTTLYSAGSWPDQVANRLHNLFAFRLEAVFILPMSTVLFLAGVLLLRAGVFQDTAVGARLRTRLVVVGLGVAAPLNLLTSLAGGGWFFADRYLLPPLVALGLLGLVTSVLLRLRAEPGVLRRGLTSVGRCALSCYVFQNLVASVLCYGWGLGLAAKLDAFRPWWVPLAWAGIGALFMSLATWWLRRFGRGPLEAAWNWAYRAPQRQLVG